MLGTGWFGRALGASVALERDTIVAGAPTDAVGANLDQGSASIFFSPAPVPPITPPAPLTPSTPSPASPRPVGLKAGACANPRRGTNAADRLTGGPGNDALTGGGGHNRYSAGSGNDTVNASNRRSERVDCGPGRDQATVDRSDRTRRCEQVRRR